MCDHVAIVAPELEENVPWLRDFGTRFGPLVPHILDQYHHPDGFEVSIIARNTGTAESRATAKPAGCLLAFGPELRERPVGCDFSLLDADPEQGR